MRQTDRSQIVSDFWQQWLENKDILYRCCFKLMNSNPTDAEDALSLAMLKAWEKVQIFSTEIVHFKAWLMKLTRNICIDIIRERSRGPANFESVEWLGDEVLSTSASVASPERVLEKQEKSVEIRRAVASLPERLRDTFILHFYEELTHTEIAELQGISYDNVCKRISLARKTLKQKLSRYFS